MITKIIRRLDKRDRQMAFFDMDCIGARVEVIIFSQEFENYENLIEEGNVVFVKGKLSNDTEFSDLKIIANSIIHVSKIRY